MAKAEAKISWVTSREVVARVARHLGCAPEDAGCGSFAKRKPAGSRRVAYLRGLAGIAASRQLARIDWDAGSLPSCEITNIELCRDDLIAADLLPGRSEERSGWWAARDTRVDYSKRTGGMDP